MITIVHARDDDGPPLVRLIASVFDEYPGCVLDVEREEPDLLGIATAFASRGGAFWVALEDLGRDPEARNVVGCVGYQPSSPTGAELKKLYVAATHRRRGLGTRLLEKVAETARRDGRHHVECWSDTRFSAGHAFYERHGFVETGALRQLDDLSRTTEKHYRREVPTPRPTAAKRGS